MIGRNEYEVYLLVRSMTFGVLSCASPAVSFVALLGAGNNEIETIRPEMDSRYKQQN